jgi:hypothetical protein
MRHRKTILSTALAALALAAPAAQATSPTVSTSSATGIGRTSATLRGTVAPHGLATSYSFQYGTTAAYGAQTASASAGSGTSTVNVSAKVTGLTPATTYHYRIVATNSDGTSAGADHTFRTANPPPRKPSILATAPFSPSANGVTFTALVNPNGATTTYRFQYGTSTAYGLETFGKSISGGFAPRSVFFFVGSLASHTTYHFRVVASNSGGTSVGPDTLATTGPFPLGKLSVVTRPHHQRRSHPFYVTKGHLVLGAGVSPAQGCGSGRVGVGFTSGRRLVAHATATLSGGHCSFRLRMRVHVARDVTRLRVHVRFGGNGILSPFSARSYLVGIG